MMKNLILEAQILFFQVGVLFSNTVTFVFEYITKFMYLYLMNDYQRMEFRNQVATRIRELKELEDPNEEMSLAKLKVIELYAWMCKNQ